MPPYKCACGLRTFSPTTPPAYCDRKPCGPFTDEGVFPALAAAASPPPPPPPGPGPGSAAATATSLMLVSGGHQPLPATVLSLPLDIFQELANCSTFRGILELTRVSRGVGQRARIAFGNRDLAAIIPQLQRQLLALEAALPDSNFNWLKQAIQRDARVEKPGMSRDAHKQLVAQAQLEVIARYIRNLQLMTAQIEALIDNMNALWTLLTPAQRAALLPAHQPVRQRVEGLLARVNRIKAWLLAEAERTKRDQNKHW
jgi:hypothetical protein